MVSAAKRSVSISVECGDITRFAADVIALKYARGLFGAAQGVASALGKTEADIQQQLPDLGSAQLYPGGGRSRPPRRCSCERFSSSRSTRSKFANSVPTSSGP